MKNIIVALGTNDGLFDGRINVQGKSKKTIISVVLNGNLVLNAERSVGEFGKWKESLGSLSLDKLKIAIRDVAQVIVSGRDNSCRASAIKVLAMKDDELDALVRPLIIDEADALIALHRDKINDLKKIKNDLIK